MYAHRISFLTLLLALGQQSVSALLLSEASVNDTVPPPSAANKREATVLVVGDVVGVPKGAGYCTQGFLRGWDGKGLASASDCIKLCSTEPDCGFVSYCSPELPQCAGPRLPGTCSRFLRNESCGPLRALLKRGSSAFHTSYEVQGKSEYLATVIAATEGAAIPEGIPSSEKLEPATAGVTHVNNSADSVDPTQKGNITSKEIVYEPPTVPKPQPLQDDTVLKEGENASARGEASNTSVLEGSNVTGGLPPRSEVNANDTGKEAEIEVTKEQVPVREKVGLEGEEGITVDEEKNIKEKAASEIDKALAEEEHVENEATDKSERELTKAEKKAHEKAKKQKEEKEADEQKAIEKRNKLELKKQKDRAKKEEAFKKKEAQKKKALEEKQKEKGKDNGVTKGGQDKDKELKGKSKSTKSTKEKKDTKNKGSNLPEETLMPAGKGQEKETAQEEAIVQQKEDPRAEEEKAAEGGIKAYLANETQLIEQSRKSRLMEAADEVEREELAAAELERQVKEDAERKATREKEERAEQERKRVEERAEEERKQVEIITQASAAKKARKEAAELLDAHRAAVEIAAQEAIKHLHEETDAAEKARIQTEALGKAAEEAGAQAKALEQAQKKAAEKARKEADARQKEAEARQKAEELETHLKMEKEKAKEQADQEAARDGKLTAAQKREIHQAFDVFDKDADGDLNAAESKVALQMMGGLPVNKDGTVGYPAFLKAMRKRILKHQELEGRQLKNKTESASKPTGASTLPSNDEALARKVTPKKVDLSLKRQHTQRKLREAAENLAADVLRAEGGTAEREVKRAKKHRKEKGRKEKAAKEKATKEKGATTNPPTTMDIMTEKLRKKAMSPEKVGLSLKRRHKQQGYNKREEAQKKAEDMLREEDAKTESEANRAKQLQKERRKQAKKAFKEMQTKSMQGGNMTGTTAFCRCVTPSRSQSAGHNAFKCTDGSSGACAEKEACFTKDPFFKGDHGSACRKAAKKKQKD